MPPTNRRRQRKNITQHSAINRLLLDRVAPIAHTVGKRPIPQKVGIAAAASLFVLVAVTLILLGTRSPASGTGVQATLNRLIGKDATASWNNGDVLVWLNFGQNSATTMAVHTRAYEIQKALWTSSLHPKSVNIGFYEAVPSKFGGSQRTYIGMCSLNAITAAKLDWNNLTATDAWGAYNIADVYTNT